jgi:phosphatidylserine/phosphatidylglycerophosphate/cardiolipin synthase-like enzyme
MKPIVPLYNEEYFAEITRKVAEAKAGSRVALISMIFSPEEFAVQNLVTELIAAAARDVQVLLVIDAHSFMLSRGDWPNGPVFWNKPLDQTSSPEYLEKLDLLERLRDAGGRYVIINMPPGQLTNPYARRSHIKSTIIDDVSYLGGCNLGGTHQIDMMLRFESTDVADYLYDMVQRIATSESTDAAFGGADQMYNVDQQTDILLDSGRPSQSLIFEQATQLVDQAKQHIFMTCQFFPDDRILRHLQKALDRGVQVDLYFNGPEAQRGPAKLGHRMMLWRAKLKQPEQFFKHQLPAEGRRLHLKLIATEQAAIIGSHNYVNAGIQFGTAELALIRRDPTFSEVLIQKIRPQL